MSRIKSTGSKPEDRLGELLVKWLPECHIVRNDSSLMGRPDFHIVDLGIAVFLDGCFFHRCPKHYRQPDQNGEYWAAKVARNAARDKLVTHTLKGQGFLVLRVWEHELRLASMPGRTRIRRRLRRLQSAVEEKLGTLRAAESRSPYNAAPMPPKGSLPPSAKDGDT